MGYTTDFKGQFEVEPALQEKHRAYLDQFAQVRHMTWDVDTLAEQEDPIREAVDLPIGDKGMFWVGHSRDNYGGPGVLDSNRPAPGVPGLWCQWVPQTDEWGEDGVYNKIGWDGGEKFYDYVRWLEFLIGHFLAPWGYTVNGEVSFQGESDSDVGVVSVRDNEVEAIRVEDELKTRQRLLKTMAESEDQKDVVGYIRSMVSKSGEGDWKQRNRAMNGALLAAAEALKNPNWVVMEHLTETLIQMGHAKVAKAAMILWLKNLEKLAASQ